MEVYAYIGDSELPSYDLDSLRVLSYIKLTKAPVDIKLKCNPFKSPEGSLPFLKDNTTIKSGYREIVKYLSNKGYDINHHLDVNERCISTGLLDYIFNNIGPYFQYTLWGQLDNINDTRGYYVKQIPFPFNFYYPRKYQNTAQQILEVLTGVDVDDKVEEQDIDEIVLTAKKCITLLSNNLNEKIWFFSKNCSELDITVYAYLRILLKIKLTKNPIEQHILNCSNLCSFMDRITKSYFNDEQIFVKPKENSKLTTNRDNSPARDDDSAALRRIQVLSVLGAMMAMGFFAVCNGIVAFSHSDASRGEDYIEYYDDGDDEN